MLHGGGGLGWVVGVILLSTITHLIYLFLVFIFFTLAGEVLLGERALVKMRVHYCSGELLHYC